MAANDGRVLRSDGASPVGTVVAARLVHSSGSQEVRDRERALDPDAQSHSALMVTDKIGVQVAADYRRVFLGEERGVENESRFTIGIVVPLAVPEGNRTAWGVVAR